MHWMVAAAALMSAPIVTDGTMAFATDEVAKPGDRIICKHQKRTGTRFTSKVCKTLDQWEAIAEDSRAGLKEMADRPHVRVCGPNGCD